ncbi:MAG: hypothetical protein MZV70_42885, partial [Desulfobacterales bacterium]|nr:hypothetical protein [Desulfobacterales bacterium]
NNHGPFSIGQHRAATTTTPRPRYERRREIIQEHDDYQQGWLYFIANDPRVPEDVQHGDAALGPGQGRVRRTTATGRTRSTCAKRAAWSGAT